MTIYRLDISSRWENPWPSPSVTASRNPTGRRRTQTDAALVVEISDLRYRMDRVRKWTTDAAADVPIYGILDLKRNWLEIPILPSETGADA